MTAALGTLVADLCRARAPGLSADARARVERIAVEVGEPLTVVVAGRVNAGKSTLVNAVLGRRVAPTDVTDCTRVVTCYRFGSPDRFDVVGRDEQVVRTARLEGGALPGELGVDVAGIKRLDVWLQIDALRSLTVVDTPGLGSTDTERARASEALLGVDRDSQAAIARADALLFVLNATVREDERAAIRSFRAVATGAGNSAANAIGVLSKADKVGGDGDPMDAATRLARRHAEALRAEVSEVVPLNGLLAETSATGGLTEADANALGALAALDPATLQGLLLSARRFVESDAPVPNGVRQRLLERLDLYGVERAVTLLQGGVDGAADLVKALGELSGMTSLTGELAALAGRRGDALKARRALDELETISFQSSGADDDARRQLRDGVEELRLSPDMHRLAELDAVEAVARGEVDLPADLDDELRRITLGDDPAERFGLPGATTAELVTAAAEAAGRWRAHANRVSPREAAVAMVVCRSCELAHGALTGDQA